VPRSPSIANDPPDECDDRLEARQLVRVEEEREEAGEVRAESEGSTTEARETDSSWV
jgi:hypothetical protein